MSTTIAVLTAALVESGYLVDVDPDDEGILRSRVPRNRDDKRPLLVGIYIVRDGRITYAEHRTRMFPFHRLTPYKNEIGRLYKENQGHGTMSNLTIRIRDIDDERARTLRELLSDVGLDFAFGTEPISPAGENAILERAAVAIDAERNALDPLESGLVLRAGYRHSALIVRGLKS